MRIEYHRTLIADRVRNAAFEAALRAVIKKGVTTVADIGTGTGLLALMAVKLGAREVFLYEAAEVAGVAAKVLKANGRAQLPPLSLPFDGDGRSAEGRCRRLRDARQLRASKSTSSRRWRRQEALPEAGRRAHSRAGRAVRGAGRLRSHPCTNSAPGTPRASICPSPGR